jgi:hypothetical protein
MHPLRRHKIEFLLDNLNDDDIVLALDLMKKQAWPHTERRSRKQYHLVGERRAWPFSEVRREHTPWVILSGLLGMTIVLAAALASIPYNPAMFWAIPGYAVYFSIVMALRAKELALSQ